MVFTRLRSPLTTLLPSLWPIPPAEPWRSCWTSWDGGRGVEPLTARGGNGSGCRMEGTPLWPDDTCLSACATRYAIANTLLVKGTELNRELVFILKAIATAGNPSLKRQSPTDSHGPPPFVSHCQLGRRKEKWGHAVVGSIPPGFPGPGPPQTQPVRGRLA